MLTTEQKELITKNIMATIVPFPDSRRPKIVFESVRNEPEDGVITYNNVDPDWEEGVLSYVKTFTYEAKGTVRILRKLPEFGLKLFTVELVAYKPRNSRYKQVKVYVTVDWESFNPSDYMFSCRDIIIEQAASDS